MVGDGGRRVAKKGLARSERFELPTLGIEIRCSIQLSYERNPNENKSLCRFDKLAIRLIDAPE
jgi:hypothetical protein